MQQATRPPKGPQKGVSTRTVGLFAILVVLALLLVGGAFAKGMLRDAGGDGHGPPLAIVEIAPVFLRLAPDRIPLKKIDPKVIPWENGQIALGIDVAGYPLIDADVKATGPSAYYMHLYYWQKDGVDLPITDSYYSLRLANDIDAKGKTFVNRFEALPVNRRADKLDRMILPDIPEGMMLHELAFFGRRLIADDDTALRSSSVAGSISKAGLIPADPASDSGSIAVRLSALSEAASQPRIAARGLSIQLDNVEAIYQVGPNHQPAALRIGPTRIGKFSPQTLVIVDRAQRVQTIGTHGADLIEIDREEHGVLITFYDYHFLERTHHFKERRISKDGIRRNINQGFTHRLPEGRLEIFWHRGDEVAFLSRHPEGHLASLTIGEHADHVVVANDPLIMFGHDDGERRIDGLGFIGNDIPISRTFFGTGGDGAKPSVRHRHKFWQDKSTERVAETVPSLEHSAELRRLLELYPAIGAKVEYGPHSAAMSRGDVVEGIKSRETMKRALVEFRPFSPRISIDHGGLEVLHVFGWNKEDPKYHTLDLLLDAGIEYLYPFADKLSGGNNMIYADHASNIFYKLPAIVPAASTEDRIEPYFYAQKQLNWDDQIFSPDALKTMLDERAILNFHTYLGNDVTLPVMDDEGAFQGRYELVPWFNEHLQHLDAFRDRGDLWLGLNAELYDFHRGLDALSLTWKEGCLRASGTHQRPIEGVTLALARFEDGAWLKTASWPSPDDQALETREADGLDYLWFDLPTAREQQICPNKGASS